MHFSIPDTQEFIDGTGTAYLSYNIHINGVFHCSVRYKQLLSLHDQLAKELDGVSLPLPLPEFPPKKLFPLTVNQQEDRRASLEKYIQSIGQNSAINNSELLNGFLLNAQQETAGALQQETEEEIQMDVFLMNGYRIPLTAFITEHSGIILKKTCKNIKLPDEYVSYFSLFLMHWKEDGSAQILRKLQDFESPIITQKNMGIAGTKVMIGKSFWDSGYDLELMHDPVALHLLYAQAVADVGRGWIPVSEDSREHLASLQANGAKKEYLEVARSMKYYGYIQFGPCLGDYPEPGSRVLVAIGKNELNLRVSVADEGECEAVFKVTRMRCWRITTLHHAVDRCKDLELSFEYLMARNQLQWITISSEQAILMSVCLQAMIDELLLKNIGGSKTQERSNTPSWTYMKRDGNSQVIMASPSVDRNGRTHQVKNSPCPPARPEPIMRKLAERLAAVTAKKSNDDKRTTTSTHSHSSMENNAFHMIGDDDL